jgi:hypothetical protein
MDYILDEVVRFYKIIKLKHSEELRGGIRYSAHAVFCRISKASTA